MSDFHHESSSVFLLEEALGELNKSHASVGVYVRVALELLRVLETS
jgi:hypothetical protein